MIDFFDLKKICYSILLVSYRFIATEEGLFDQIRIDHGKEFYLSLFVQEQLAHLRYNPQRDPHRQTTSKKVSVNSRFLLPVPLLLPVTTVVPESAFFIKKKKVKTLLGIIACDSTYQRNAKPTNAVTEDL